MYSHSAEGADLSTLTAILSDASHTECAHTEDPVMFAVRLLIELTAAK